MTFEEMLAADKQNSAQKENGNYIKEATQTAVYNASKQEFTCMSNEDVKKILYQQLQLLAEKSKDADTENLIRLSAEMDRVANTLLRDYSDD